MSGVVSQTNKCENPVFKLFTNFYASKLLAIQQGTYMKKLVLFVYSSSYKDKI